MDEELSEDESEAVADVSEAIRVAIARLHAADAAFAVLGALVNHLTESSPLSHDDIYDVATELERVLRNEMSRRTGFTRRN